MRKRILTFFMAFALLGTPGIDVRAAGQSYSSEAVATDTDAPTVEEQTEDTIPDETVYMNSYIDTGDRIDYYTPVNGAMLYSNNIPASYDSRNYGRVTSVKNQNPYGTCWTFAALAAGESSMISAGYVNDIDLSEYHLAYFFYNCQTDPLGNVDGDRTYLNSSYGNNYLSVGGNNYLTMFALSSWRGAASESVAPYGNASPSSTLDASLAYKDVAHLQNARVVSIKNAADVKKLIMDYGTVASGFNMNTFYYNYETKGYYNYNDKSSNHAIAIVGWDDNYAVDNFTGTKKPSKPGAWLVKNSWGEGNIPYLWVSYEDLSISNQDAIAFVMEPADNYDNNYQYDGTFSPYYGTINNGGKIANVYVAKASSKEEIKATAISLKSDNVRYSIQIYKNPDADNPESGEAMLATPVTGQTTYAGYYTIKLPSGLYVDKGDKYSVVYTLVDQDDKDVSYFLEQTTSAQLSDDVILYDCHTEQGQSFCETGYGLNYFVDLGSGKYPMCARVKVFTDNVSTTGSATLISSCNVNNVKTQYYTGKVITPEVDLTYNGATLVKNRDYTITYSKNVNPGIAVIKITGIGKYSGTRTVSFNILAKKNPTTVYEGVDYSAVYDYNYYVTKYSDIWSAYKTDDIAAIRHFATYGMKERRQAKATFDVKSYMYRYVDLRNAYGNNYPAYYLHYINYGYKEGRKTTGTKRIIGATTVYEGVDYSAVYNFDYYIQHNNDVKKKYEFDDVGALRHFVTYGMREKRQGCASFNVDAYAMRYADLRRVYKNDMVAYYKHYVNYGKKEGRVATGTKNIIGGMTTYNGVNYSAVYNYGYYVSHNSDIKRAFGYDEEAALRHFIYYGMSEGRQGSEAFNVTHYKNRYADLRRAYGSKLKNYYMHYINYGVKEHRNGK